MKRLTSRRHSVMKRIWAVVTQSPAEEIEPNRTRSGGFGDSHEFLHGDVRAGELLATDKGQVGVLEIGGAEIGRELAGRSLGGDAALVDEGDLVAELLGLLEVMGRQQDRRALLVDPLDVVP